jgi:hypothetical protein
MGVFDDECEFEDESDGSSDGSAAEFVDGSVSVTGDDSKPSEPVVVS